MYEYIGYIVDDTEREKKRLIVRRARRKIAKTTKQVLVEEEGRKNVAFFSLLDSLPCQADKKRLKKIYRPCNEFNDNKRK